MPMRTVAQVSQVTAVQAKIALLRHGLLDQVKAKVAADPELQIWFDNAPMWERNNIFIDQLGASLGLDDDQIDALFNAATQVR